MKISRFVKLIEIGDEEMVAIYHTLLIKTLFIARSIANSIMLGNVELELIDSEIKAGLCANGFFVEDISDDDKLIQEIRGDLPQPYICVMYLILTDSCNFNCRYCFIENQFHDEAREFMSYKTARQAINRYVELLREDKNDEARKAIIFYGGEPLLNLEVFRQAVKYINKLKINKQLPEDTIVSLITNGSLLDEEIADFIKANGIGLSVSLDGDILATDSYRNASGSPVFNMIMQKIDILREREVQYGISCTINPETIRRLDDHLKFFIEDLNVKNIGFNVIMQGSGLDLDQDYNKKANDLLIEAFKRFRKEGIYEERIMRKVKAFVDQKIHPYDCSACGGHEMAVAPNGDVGVCHGYTPKRKYFVGNVNNTELRPEKSDVYLEWNKRSPLFMDQCQDCVALGICGGGCPCNADYLTGSIWNLDERFCIHAKETLQWMILDLWAQCSN